ncbi:MAG TPA: hypothetical protein QGH10_04330, partial [Armatimonadota bacterium]|nr:hypothetical protein [Armatimonadota bacterium]
MLPIVTMLVCLLLAITAVAGAEPPSAVVEVEEDVYTYEPADNGAGPLWCHGSTCLVRIGDRVLASGLETIEGMKPMNNVRWTLWTRDADRWRLVRTDEAN